MSIATEIQRLQTAKDDITRALQRVGYYIPSGITLDEYPPYIDPYFFEELTFKISAPGTINWTASDAALTKTVEYSKNNGNWTSITSTTAGTSISVSAGDNIKFRGNNTYYYNNGVYTSFSGSTAKFSVEGNIMSLIDSTGYTSATTLEDASTFSYLFCHCTGLTSAENLVLPATALTSGCYHSMFLKCTSLTTAPALPATTLANSCYQNMFSNCTSLTSAPSLSATTLANQCYLGMFQDCTSLTTAPALPATTLAPNCYNNMFEGCTLLTTAPSLPATTLANQCYSIMFKNCTSLTTAPELPASALTSNCYSNMFMNCTGLTTAPTLPATTLANNCYSYMFYGCTSLTTAPVLPATTLTGNCYSYMFQGCSSLNYIKCLATDISASNCTRYWVNNVASTGTFVKNPNMTGWTTGNNGIPNNWTVENLPVEIYCDDFYFDFDNPDDSPLARECIDNHWTPEDWLNNYNNHNWPGVNMFELEDENFIFNGKRYYLYKYEEGGQIKYYGLLSEERSRLSVLRQNSISQDVDNYLNNYYAFDYILESDMAMTAYGGLSEPGHFIVVWAE